MMNFEDHRLDIERKVQELKERIKAEKNPVITKILMRSLQALLRERKRFL